MKARLSYERMFFVPRINNGGGIALFWKDNSLSKLLAFSNNFIDVAMSITGMIDWRLTFYYGFPEKSIRQLSWNMLKTLSRRSPLLWCCVEDFNDIFSQSKKRGRLKHPYYLINGFRETVEACELIDLDMKCHYFTWEKSIGSSNFVE